MNARVRYITAAIFLLVLQSLINSELWVLSFLFAIVTVIYICLEFYGLRPKYFIRASIIVIIFSYFFGQALLISFINSKFQSIAEFSVSFLQQYVFSGLYLLGSLF